MLGGSIIDNKELNSRLKTKGYSEFSDNFISMGGGGHTIINRVILGGEGHGFVEKEATTANYKSSITAGYGFFNIAYVVYSDRGLNVYPLLGLGGVISLKIMERGLASFDGVLDNPKRSAELSTGAFLLKLAVGADWLLRPQGDKEEEGGLVFGLRTGYTFAAAKGDWSMDGIEIGGSPSRGQRTIYPPYDWRRWIW